MSLRRVLVLLLAALLGLAVLGGAAPAGAVDNPTYTAPPPATTITSPGPTTTAAADDEVVTAVKVEAARTRLAITGSDATGLAVLGGVLVLAGVGVLVARRRAASPLT